MNVKKKEYAPLIEEYLQKFRQTLKPNEIDVEALGQIIDDLAQAAGQEGLLLSDLKVEINQWETTAPMTFLIQKEKPSFSEEARLSLCEKMLLHGYDTHEHMKANHVPLYAAIEKGFVRLTELILACEDGPMDPGWDSDMINKAVRGNQAQIISLLHHNGYHIQESLNHVDMSPILLAASHSKEESLHQLIELGVDVNQQDKSGSTPLHMVAHHFFSASNQKMAQSLLDAGADPLICDYKGRTVFQIESHSNQETLVFIKEYALALKERQALTQVAAQASSNLSQQVEPPSISKRLSL